MSNGAELRGNSPLRSPSSTSSSATSATNIAPIRAAFSEAARRRLSSFEAAAPFHAQRALHRSAEASFWAIVDDYYDSCRSVLLFEQWKCERASIWCDWISQQREHVMLFNALASEYESITASLYTTAAYNLKVQVHLSARRRRNEARGAAEQCRAVASKRRVIIPTHIQSLSPHRAAVVAVSRHSSPTDGESGDRASGAARSSGGVVRSSNDASQGDPAERRGNQSIANHRQSGFVLKVLSRLQCVGSQSH